MATINTDVYNMAEVLLDLHKSQLDEVPTETAVAGLYGSINSALAKMMVSNIRVQADLCDESLPSKAKHKKYIVSHAASYEIDGITAKPANMSVLLYIVEDDLLKLFDKYENVVISDKCKFIIGDYEYHLHYPIKIERHLLVDNNYVYTAVYDMSVNNTLSDITNPYLDSPYTYKNSGYTYITISTELMQVELSTHYQKNVTSSAIDNKTYIFSFENQLAAFDITVIEGGVTKYVTPRYKGTSIDDSDSYYCFYTIVDDTTVRVEFDSNSIIPGINAEIMTRIFTSQGDTCNFSFTTDILSVLEDTEDIAYNSTQVMISPISDSSGGKDAKTTEELQLLLPKAKDRGNIINSTDLINYFNINSDSKVRITPIEKVSNNILFCYYTYLLMKDNNNNIIPTNTINLKLKTTDADVVKEIDTETRQYIFKQGIKLGYNLDSEYAVKVTDSRVVYDYYYTIPYDMVISDKGPFISYFMKVVNDKRQLQFSTINNSSPLQFICSGIKWKRDIDSDKYVMTATIMQNINTDYGIYDKDPEGNLIKGDGIKFIVVCDSPDDNQPYRYFMGDLKSWELTSEFKYTFDVDFTTDDVVDPSNRIQILNGYRPLNDELPMYGFFGGITSATIYIMCKFKDENGDVITYNTSNPLSNIVSNISDYTCTNVYKIIDGIQFINNFSDISTSIIDVSVADSNIDFNISSVPVIGYNYARSSSFLNFIDILKNCKVNIENVSYITDGSFTIDLKFYNTFGPSKLSIVDENGTKLDKVNISPKLTLSLNKTSDTYTKDYIITDLKSAIENLDRDNKELSLASEIGTIQNKYSASVKFLQGMGFNKFDANYQNITTSPASGIFDVPEFICVNINSDGNPDISVKVL